MPEHASRLGTDLYDQFEDQHPVADWGGDELFNRMPRPRAVDDAPPPRYGTTGPRLALVEPLADAPRSGVADAVDRDRRPARGVAPGAARRGPAAGGDGATPGAARRGPAAGRDGATPGAPRRGAAARPAGEQPMHARAERLGLAVAEPAPTQRWEASGAPTAPAPRGRRTTIITGNPDRAPRPLATVRAERRRPVRTPAEWVGAKPERIVAWAFVLGLLLIMIAVSTADAATL